MGSLKNESVERLQDAGLLDGAEREDGESSSARPSTAQISRHARSREVRGNPWMEEMIEGSELGRIKRRKGGHTSADGSTRYEWEVVEVGGGGEVESDGTGTGPGKRKLGEVGGDDAEMRE